jgi:hypothetical protein
MIELQRAKLGLPPAGSSTVAPNSSHSPKPSPLAAAGKQQTPEEAATATLLSDDAQMERFINRLQRRDDSQPFVGNDPTGFMGPTVPTALSRRMLQRQGVGYLDSTVASVVSASADRFLATVLQQAIACRDQRLKGAAMSREAAKHRKRHMQHYKADTDDRKRRKELIENARETVALHTIAQAEAFKKGGVAGKTAAADDKKNTKSKKTKKKEDPNEANPTNGTKLDPSIKKLAEEEEEDYDSIDEEEEYYQENVGDVAWGRGLGGDDDEEDEDDTLLLRDIVRPLEAWNFHLTGKEALESDGEESDEDEEDDEDADNTKADISVAQTDEGNNNDDSMSLANGMDGNKDDDGETDAKKAGSAITSPGAKS